MMKLHLLVGFLVAGTVFGAPVSWQTLDFPEMWNVPGKTVFLYPEGSDGWRSFGFTRQHDGTRDWRGYHGIQMNVTMPVGRTLELEATLVVPGESGRGELIPGSKAVVTVTTGGRVTIPLNMFDFNKGQPGFLHYIRGLQLAGKLADGASGTVKLENVRLVRAPSIFLEAKVRGKAAAAGGTVRYEVTVGNCTDSPQVVNPGLEKYGWEAFQTSVTPGQLILAPGSTGLCVVSVSVPVGIPAGGHERQTLRVGDATLDLVTACDLPRPHILMTRQGWDEIRGKVKKYDWAREAQADYVKIANKWKVPEVATPEQRANAAEKHPYVFMNGEFNNSYSTAIAWQLTGRKEYAEKVALFLRRLADEKTGYASTMAATNLGEPQEGGNFQGVAIAYDAILESGVLSIGDRVAIESMLRLYMENIEDSLTVGNIGNWSTAACVGGLFCSLAMGDLAAAERYLYGSASFMDYLTKGVMDDGWWWECSTSYNFWVASELTQAALACRPWGIDLLNAEFPSGFSPHTIITPWGLTPKMGMSFEKWGAIHRNTRSIKQLWDAVPITADYRGVAFGMNDGHEEDVGSGGRLEIGYYAFRDPQYVPLLKLARKRDLIYGVPELPDVVSQPYRQSGYAENLGFALLRSQTDGRPTREQIEAVFKIGTQGGYHGHFDRCALNTIMRYGRSFWNPESIWWGYGNYMYKFYVQNSVAHNMVVVDQQQQEAVPSTQPLFHAGKMMQVVIHETTARWSCPPYGGMPYATGDEFKDYLRRNRQSIPLVAGLEIGEIGAYSEPVLQRRLGIVVDDYIVIADYLKAGKPHTFDNLFQMRGFTGVNAQRVRHEAQYSPDPRLSAQFITDCDWYQAVAPVTGRFEMTFDGSGHNEAGTLKLDVHSIWPTRHEIMVGRPPETKDGRQWVAYKLVGDGKTLARGESGVWILGAMDIDVPVAGVKELSLAITTDDARKKTLYLANARFVDAAGRETPYTAGAQTRDYFGGPIKIAGLHYTNAIPVQPSDPGKPLALRIPVTGERFRAVLGGDSPFGDESQCRNVYAIRSTGTEARFLTVIEPYEDKPVIKSASAVDADHVRVELADGRVQEITITGLEEQKGAASVEMVELKDNEVVRRETTR